MSFISSQQDKPLKLVVNKNQEDHEPEKDSGTESDEQSSDDGPLNLSTSSRRNRPRVRAARTDSAFASVCELESDSHSSEDELEEINSRYLLTPASLLASGAITIVGQPLSIGEKRKWSEFKPISSSGDSSFSPQIPDAPCNSRSSTPCGESPPNKIFNYETEDESMPDQPEQRQSYSPKKRYRNVARPSLDLEKMQQLQQAMEQGLDDDVVIEGVELERSNTDNGQTSAAQRNGGAISASVVSVAPVVSVPAVTSAVAATSAAAVTMAAAVGRRRGPPARWHHSKHDGSELSLYGC